MNKEKIMYFVLIGITTALLYIGMTALNATILWSMNDNVMRAQQFIALILSGIGAYFIFKPIVKKKLFSKLSFDSTIIIAVLVANIFKAFVTDFSLAYISLMIATLYLILKE